MTDELKEREAELQARFYAACKEILDIDQALTLLANDIYHAGGQPAEILHRPDAVAGAKAVLDRIHHQEILVARLKQDAEPKSKKPRRIK